MEDPRLNRTDWFSEMLDERRGIERIDSVRWSLDSYYQRGMYRWRCSHRGIKDLYSRIDLILQSRGELTNKNSMKRNTTWYHEQTSRRYQLTYVGRYNVIDTHTLRHQPTPMINRGTFTIPSVSSSPRTIRGINRRWELVIHQIIRWNNKTDQTLTLTMLYIILYEWYQTKPNLFIWSYQTSRIE